MGSAGEDDAACNLVNDLVAEEIADDLEAELQGGAGAAAGDDLLVDDDRVLVDDRTALGDGLNERRVRGRVAAVEHAQFGQDRGGRANRCDGLGLVGAAIPLGVMLFVYRQTVEYVMNRFELLSGIIQFLPLGTFYPMMAATALALGGGLGFFVSFFTIRKELRV